jgi:hypothetical protein
MAQISWTGAFNAATLTVPDVYLNIIAPGATLITPASANVLGIVGVAKWGPKNLPSPIAGNASSLLFGQGPVVQQYDLLTGAQVALDIQGTAGVGGILASRVTDGTDVAATGNVGGATALTLTSKYTGSFGNQCTATLSAGTAAGSWRLVIQMPGITAENFDNMAAGLSGNAIWVAIAAALNNGISGQRGPSQLVVAAAGASVTTPVAGVTTLASGTDGATTITSAILVGTNTAGAPTGVYAFTGTGVSDLVVMDLSDINQESTLQTFALSTGIYVHCSGAPSESAATAAMNMTTTGTNAPFVKRLLGDWVYYQDNYNGVQRLLCPAIFSGAIMTSQQINGSSLNKQIPNVLATQRSRTNVPYSPTELAMIKAARVDVICNPIPQGSMFGMRLGINTSSDATRNGDNYPRMTSWLARSMAGPSAFGPYIGEDITPTFFQNAYDTANTFLLGLVTNGLIQNYQVNCSAANNPQSQTSQGIVVAQIYVQYYAIAMVFLINLQSGQTVVIPANTQYSISSTQAA